MSPPSASCRTKRQRTFSESTFTISTNFCRIPSTCIRLTASWDRIPITNLRVRGLTPRTRCCRRCRRTRRRRNQYICRRSSPTPTNCWRCSSHRRSHRTWTTNRRITIPRRTCRPFFITIFPDQVISAGKAEKTKMRSQYYVKLSFLSVLSWHMN